MTRPLVPSRPGRRKGRRVTLEGVPMGRFSGRRALVTGAASGIGASTARRLAAEGASVACLDRDLDGLDATVGAVRASGGSAFPVGCDLADRDAIGPAVD